ncbi:MULTISPECIES: integrase core domain-containing protein [Spiribacter]|uniref:integrase core domain-containing protein n=1 Tax=Spiribacter TaxID=1335745 RepID=UPI00132F7BF7|nr:MULTISPECIES: integrase core domain-containing protein [Spiribacter]
MPWFTASLLTYAGLLWRWERSPLEWAEDSLRLFASHLIRKPGSASSNDNPFSESIFATCKAMPAYPANGFGSLEAAREWVQRFVQWYNHEHRHSGIQYITPVEQHNGKDAAILARRQQVYGETKARNPRRWSREIRDWRPVGAVHLNPEKERRDSRLTRVA